MVGNTENLGVGEDEKSGEALYEGAGEIPLFPQPVQAPVDRRVEESDQPEIVVQLQQEIEKDDGCHRIQSHQVV